MYKLLKFTKTNCTNAHVCTHTLLTYKPSIPMRSPKSTNLQVKVGSLWTIKLMIQFIGNFLTCEVPFMVFNLFEYLFLTITAL